MNGWNWNATKYHVGWPVDTVDALERIRRGLPVYWPTDARPIDQTPYTEYAKKRGTNSE